MGAGQAGVGLLENVGAREAVASAGDVAILNRLSPHENGHGNKLPPSRTRKLGHLALTMAVAIAAQKVGPGVVEHVSANLTHGAGHFIVPLTSMVGATAGVNSIIKRRL